MDGSPPCCLPCQPPPAAFSRVANNLLLHIRTALPPIPDNQVPIVKTQLLPVDASGRPLPSAGGGGGGGGGRLLSADISMGAANGAAAVALVQRAVAWVPPLRPLCLVLKVGLSVMMTNCSIAAVHAIVCLLQPVAACYANGMEKARQARARTSSNRRRGRDWV